MLAGKQEQKCVFSFGSARDVELTRFVLSSTGVERSISTDNHDRRADGAGPELDADNSPDGNCREKTGNDLFVGLGRHPNTRHRPPRQSPPALQSL